jgi:putative salt-induced outer membrane protein YdiY
MHFRRFFTAAVALLILVAPATHLWAQQPPPPPGPPQGLSGTAGFGLSLTQGNSDTLNVSAAVDSIYDPKTGNVMKWNLLYLRGKQNGVLSVNRVSAMFRDEHAFSERMFLYGEFDAFHDTFKGIDYLLSPTIGVGYKVVNTMRTQFAVDAGVGAVIETDTGAQSRGSGAVTLGEKLVQQLTDTATLKEVATALLKTNDVADGLYTFQFGIAAKLSNRLQLSLDVIDSFKNKPFNPVLKKNDVAVVTSIVAKY